MIDLIKAHPTVTLAACAILLTCAGLFLAWIIRQNRKEREKWEAVEKERFDKFRERLKQRS